MKFTLTVENFRSIREARLPISPSLNVLVGANGSGKTNVLHALKFVSNVIEHGAAVALGKAGGPRRNFRRGQTEMRFTVEGKYGDCLFNGSRQSFLFRWNVKISQSGQDIARIAEESLIVYPDLPLGSTEIAILAQITRPKDNSVKTRSHVIDSDRSGKNLFSRPDGNTYSMRKQELFESARKGISDVLSRARKASDDRCFLESLAPLNSSIYRILRRLKSLEEYNFQPDVARQASDLLPDAKLSNDGAGLSEIVDALTKQDYRRLYSHNVFSEHGPRFMEIAGHRHYFWDLEQSHRLKTSLASLRKNPPIDTILENLRAAVNSIDSLETEIDQSTGRRYTIFKSGEHRFRPQEVSDGTIKWLCSLITLFLPYSELLLLEEPENFMHPWMQQRFIALAREQSKKLRLSVVLTTHSVTTLNSLDPSELLLVTQRNGETEVNSLTDADKINEFLKETNFGLGDLWVSGGIGAVTGIE